MNGMILFLEILGTIAFSVSGAIEAMKKNMDLLGVLVLGLVTAVGGGILRDMIMGELPPAAFRNPRNVIIAIVAAFLAFIVGAVASKKKKSSHKNIWNQILLISDAVGLGAFTILGIRCVHEQYGYNNPALLLFVGVITGVGGGLIRDIFAGNVPYIFRKHIYATASLAGAAAYLCLEKTGYIDLATAISLLIVLLVRLFAARFQWNLPRVHLEE
ncbi:MAG: trimeric intracellular cation channel family protein [Lachnospira sp.]